MTHFAQLDLPTFADSRGALTVLEGVLPFPIARVYWIYGSDNQTRGGHRHHNTRQALIATSGIVTIHLNDGVMSDNIELNSPNRCLLVEPKDWHTMTFGKGAVLLVISSHPYDRSEYIDTPYDQ